ncbi:MAG: sulfurtransferase complex subunit TusD [Candidatus Methylumidiphilus sp.]
MKFAIQINSAPWRGGGSDSAYQFILAALRLGHEVVRVFFYHDGACHGLPMAPPDDEMGLIRRWSALAAGQNVDLVICISAAQRRGLPEAAVADGFRIAGLGLWIDACLKADRVLTFGG